VTLAPADTLEGGCHCGRVRFRVAGPLTGVTACNCTICTKKGFLHWIVPLERFDLLAGRADLTTYRFNTGVAQHTFCATCGMHPFYVPRSDPDKIDINVRCLDDVDLNRIDVAPFDGRNWEEAMGGHVPWRVRETTTASPFVLVAIMGVRRAALDQFRAYEHQAATIMRKYGGAIARTVAVNAAATDALINEVHVVTFPSAEAFAAYRQDPDLARAAPLRQAAIETTQILIGSDGPSYG
jgi:uncharacterized protein (DUF1330 family)